MLSFPQDQAHASLSTVFLFALHTLLGLRFSCGASTRLSTFGFPSPRAHASRPTVFPVGAAHASPSTVFLFAEHTLVRAQFLHSVHTLCDVWFSCGPGTRFLLHSFPFRFTHAQPSAVFSFTTHTRSGHGSSPFSATHAQDPTVFLDPKHTLGAYCTRFTQCGFPYTLAHA